MSHLNPGRRWGPLLMLTGVLSAPAAYSDPLSVVQMLREGGCGGIVPAAPPLPHSAALDRAAEQRADGHSLNTAAELGAPLPENLAELDVSGSDESLIQRLRRSECRAVSSRDLREVGVYRRGPHTWLVLASSYRALPPSTRPDMAEHNYFEHEDLAGQSPADRVRAVGYREKLVGENIAYGPAA